MLADRTTGKSRLANDKAHRQADSRATNNILALADSSLLSST